MTPSEVEMRVFPVRIPLLAAALLLLALPAAPQALDAEASFNAGLAHLREGRTGLALEEFKKAVKQDPKNAYFYKGLGLAYASQRSYGDALSALRKALELNPYYVDVRNDLGTVLILSGKRKEGKAEFLAAYNDPMNPAPELSSRNLGQAYLQERDYPEAANWFRTSLNRNKAYPDSYLGLADALVALGRGDEAIVHLETGLKDMPDHPGLLFTLGDHYFRVGRYAEARTKLEEAARKDPVGAAGRRAAERLKNFPR